MIFVLGYNLNFNFSESLAGVTVISLTNVQTPHSSKSANNQQATGACFTKELTTTTKFYPANYSLTKADSKMVLIFF
jgi:hypothetical protein